MTGVARGAPVIGFPGPQELLLLAHSVTSRKAALRLVAAPASLSTERMFRDGR
jgi:hypothetical protein